MYLFTLCLWYVHVHHMSGGQKTAHRSQFSPSIYESWRLNSDRQGWQQTFLLTEPSHQLISCAIK